MKISYDWIKQYVDTEWSPEELGDRLSYAGLACEMVEPYGSDKVLELEITANRPDWLSHIGVAREVAVLGGSELRLPSAELATDERDTKKISNVIVVNKDLCHRYTARLITGVKVGPSPDWLVKRVESMGLRSINNVVDVTNFVLFETGQPLHAFDFDKLGGHRIVVRSAEQGEKITLINGREYELNPSVLVIADVHRPIAVAGVMGGVDTEVGEGTTNVLLEGAVFDPISIRRTARSMDFSTDASYRFERGIDNNGLDFASRRACCLINEVAGGKTPSGVIDTSAYGVAPIEVQLRLAEVSRIVGVEIPRRMVYNILKGLGFNFVHEDTARMVVEVPSWRHDVCREIDLIEEVARIYGYDKVPEHTAAVVEIPETSPTEKLRNQLRDLMVTMGHFENRTSTFASEKLCRMLDFYDLSDKDLLAVRNPIRQNEGYLRTSVASSLLLVKKSNQDHGTSNIRVFEIGRAYFMDGKSGEPSEKEVVSILDDDGYYSLKGVLESMFKNLRLEYPDFKGVELRGIKDGTGTAIMTVSDRRIGVFGEIAESVAAELGLKNTPAVAEIDIAELLDLPKAPQTFTKLPKFPAIYRDLAFVVDEKVTWADVLSKVKSVSTDFIEDVCLMDVYRGKQVPADKKSIAFSIILRSGERTLTDSEASKVQEDVINSMKTLNAQLRS